MHIIPAPFLKEVKDIIGMVQRISEDYVQVVSFYVVRKVFTGHDLYDHIRQRTLEGLGFYRLKALYDHLIEKANSYIYASFIKTKNVCAY